MILAREAQYGLRIFRENFTIAKPADHELPSTSSAMQR
jgi:hypothetical protein